MVLLWTVTLTEIHLFGSVIQKPCDLGNVTLPDSKMGTTLAPFTNQKRRKKKGGREGRKEGKGRKDERKNENTADKCMTHNGKLNDLLEYSHRQKNGKSHQSSSHGKCL